MSSLAAVLAAAVTTGIAPSRPLAYQSFRVGTVYYHSVVANLDSPKVRASVVHAEGLVSPWRLLSAVQPEAAITGTFFAPGIGTPVADVLIDGELVAKGNRGTALAVDPDGKLKLIDKPFRRRLDWDGYRFGLRGTVRLISSGKVVPNPPAQRFTDPQIWGIAARTGVGLTAKGKLVMMATSNRVTLSQFGRAMRSRGVVDAVSLDGGGSTCLYYRGAMVVRTARGLSTMFAVSESG